MGNNASSGRRRSASPGLAFEADNTELSGGKDSNIP